MLDIEGKLRRCIDEEGSSGVRAALEVTGRCQNKCFYCYAQSLRNQGEMPVGVLDESVTALTTLGFQEVYVVGGEPMMNPNIVEICKKLHDSGLKLILVSNGFKLDNEAIVREILPYLDQVEISIRSPNPQIHDRISRGMGPLEGPLPNASSSFTQAIEALQAIDRIRKENNLSTKIAINHDLYQHQPDEQGHGTVYQIAQMLNDRGITPDGFYLQLDSNPANHELVSVYGLSQPDKDTFLKALADLKIIRNEFGINDISVTDNPQKIRSCVREKECQLLDPMVVSEKMWL